MAVLLDRVQTGGLTRLGVAQNRRAAAEGGAAAVVAAAAAAAAQAAAPDPHHHPDLLGRTHWRQRHNTGRRGSSLGSWIRAAPAAAPEAEDHPVYFFFSQ